MIYIRGNRRDYGHGNFLGNGGWSYDHVLPYFKKSEDFEEGRFRLSRSWGTTVMKCPNPTPVAHAFIEAAGELGYHGPDWDFNDAQQEDGAGIYQVNITKEGKRCSSADAFLKPILNHPRLMVEILAQVICLLFERKRVVGIEYIQDGQLHRRRAEQEVILCAGALILPNY